MKRKKLIPADNGCFQYVGRIDFDDPKRPVMAWPGSYADVNFTGTSAAVVLKNINLQEDTHFAVIVDGVMKKITLPTNREDELFTAAEGLEDKQHTLRILKTMASHNYIELVGIVVDEGAEVTNPAHKYDMKLEVYGDSVSAGEVTEALYYEGQCDPEDHRNRLDNSHLHTRWLLQGSSTRSCTTSHRAVSLCWTAPDISAPTSSPEWRAATTRYSSAPTPRRSSGISPAGPRRGYHRHRSERREPRA